MVTRRPARRRGPRAGAIGVVAGLGASALAASAAFALDTVPCRATVLLEPTSAVVGEQVRYRVRILRRPEVVAVRWLRSPTFPSWRVEWLPGRTPDPRIREIGPGWLVFEERRALFPAAAGRLEIPAAEIGCALTDDTEFAADVPATFLAVDPLPDAGRPTDFTGIVGPVRVRTHLSAPLVRVGDSVALAISITGTGNVWSAAPPLDPARELPDIDAFPRAPELDFARGETLSARRTFVWDLVPRRPGRLTIPAAGVAYFNPVSQRYERAAGPPLPLEVLASATHDAASAAHASGGAGLGAEASEGAGAGWPTRIGLALALLAGGGGIAAVRARRRCHAPRRAAAAALARAEAAAARGDRDTAARELAAALRSALAPHLAGADAREPALEPATALLASLDRARFAAPDAAPELPPPATVRAAVHALASRKGSGWIRQLFPQRGKS